VNRRWPGREFTELGVDMHTRFRAAVARIVTDVRATYSREMFDLI